MDLEMAMALGQALAAALGRALDSESAGALG